MILTKSLPAKNTQLGSIVDQDQLPAYSRDQNFEKRKYFGVVRVVDSATFKGFCSAFVISDDYAISAAHCFYDENARIKDKEYKIGTDTVIDEETALQSVLYTPAHLVGIHVAGDYALLKGDFKEITHLKINVSPLVMEQITNRSPLPGFEVPLFALGYPNGIKDGAGYMQVSCRQIADYVQCRGAMFHGLSGGALFDPITKEVVAINYAIGENGDTYFKLMMGIFEAFNIVVE